MSHHDQNRKISKKELNRSEFTVIEQFVDNVYSFSSQYGNNISISYTAPNIIGPPSKFPEYGDFPQAFAMRTYGLWWDKAPSRSIDYMPQNNPDVVSQDYIDIEYREPVYPIRVSIYELYNPGSVIAIWAQDCYGQWFQLWSGLPQIVTQQSRLFSPPLQLCNFKTKMLRLEFNHSLLDYYTELDAVSLIGTSEMMFPKDPSNKRNLSDLLQDTIYGHFNNIADHNLTPHYENPQQNINNLKVILDEYYTTYESNNLQSMLISDVEQIYHSIPPIEEGLNNMQQFLIKDLPRFVNNVEASSNEPKELCGNFSILSIETILKILKKLDLKSLYRISRVNKYFYNLALDPLLYTSLNLKPYWHSFNARTLHNLSLRCKYLRRLDLSWCGNHGMFSATSIKEFLIECGSLLTHLRLNCCKNVDDSTIYQISVTCKNLKELCLRNCQSIQDKGFEYLENLEFLERLDFYRTSIKTETLCKILQKNRWLRHLNVVGTFQDNINIDIVAMELGRSCPNLESIDFWKAQTLTALGINALAACKNLREVDFSWCGNTSGHGETLVKLFSCCQFLEKIFLATFRGLTDRDLKGLTQCKHLKQLDLLGALSLTPEICYEILSSCPKLELMDLSFCDNINNFYIEKLRQEYPHVAIKRIMDYH
ncbi:F-box/LRR-repeat protein 4 [Camponotus floridanus]|uniref:F-box/LRR-repeat protein 4 n=1 Tax=Camponotus floridanus TaxID=104421 RepID=E2ARZ3_CAMFO|nr:F-box/LRR-repeat protein 4 [Camponotus floridanus]